MAGGLVALLDDVAALAKLAAASVDDVAAAAGKAGVKAAGVVVDDTAVTPRYVVGLPPQRELPIIAKIATGSLFNKVVILLPVALGLSALAPWAITPILMLGGAFLCYEATEKVWEAVSGQEKAKPVEAITDAAELEKRQVSGAIRTDLILSAEIMAIALGEIAASPLLTQAIVLALVALAITVGVYGAVALIVKMDDLGLLLTTRPSPGTQAIGRALVKTMPVLLGWLSLIGTAAMLWVGGGIVLHGLEVTHLWAEPAFWQTGLGEAVEQALPTGGALGWLASATVAAIGGLVVGGAIVAVMHLIPRRKAAR